MLIRELMELLADQDPDTVVVLSKDSEGNGFNKLEDYSTGYNFDHEDREIGIRDLTDELAEQGYTDEDVMEDGVPCIVLWP
jgi:hypothetical protein